VSSVSDERSWARAADRLGTAAARDGEPTRWFEELWSAAVRDEVDAPWDHTEPMPAVARHLTSTRPGEGRRAVVVGVGLGADAQATAAHGWETTAFDISPSAIELVTARYPDSPVDFRVADLLDLPDDLRGAFDLVVEVFTVQAMPPSVRERAGAGLRALLRPGGEMLVVQAVRADGAPYPEEPPWPLDEAEMRALAADDVRLVSLDRQAAPEDERWPLWTAVLRREA
jgi:SAM-dependent methyltransferase